MNCLPLLRRWFSAKAHLTLRPYQEECIESCLDALRAGYSRIGVSSPTGSGKTTMFVSLISRLTPSPERPNASRSLIIVNSIELARQAADTVHRILPDVSVDIEQGQHHRASGSADVTVATYQSLLRDERIRKFDPVRLKAVIIDEAHHAAAPSYRRLLSHFHHGIVEDGSETESKASSGLKVPIVGFSATFSRHDGVALGSIFERIVYHRDFLEMIRDNWLCPVRFTSVKAQVDLSRVSINSGTGDFNARSLAHVINTSSINKLVVQSWLDRAANRRSSLVFCVNIAHVHGLTNAFRQAGVDARYLYSKTPQFERKALLDSFRRGEFPVLVNCAILTEGADIPNIDCVVVARPTRSKNVFAQMIGRGMRLSPETLKKDCHIIDFVDTMCHVSGVVSAPTLFGLSPDTEVTDNSTEDLESLAQQTKEVQLSPPNDVPEPKSVTYIDYDNPWSLVDDASGDPHISKMSKNVWVACGGGHYVLECMGRGYIKISPSARTNGDSHYVAHYTAASMKWSEAKAIGLATRFRSRRNVLTADTLERAIQGCDTYARTRVVYGPMQLGLLHSAKWRRDPATEGQLAYLKKRFKMDNAAASQSIELPTHPGAWTGGLRNLTKGQAANIITRLQHGAKAHYDRKQKMVKKAHEAAARMAERVERETVRVGPLRR
ncbi:P-loop containing nucleoside triphosphate hydrolase protein [Cantharellus anzutake]|uniref:P-loop containing nucleoside triphosphate hydrolase protein n=1 Tax=Cantharellus anzutake TaxID=1750568 RepID=UPI00190398FD|nr:P-loop containing nucleoside triphosphate hydrolase protein [Cantharellus anzutake]KAF8327906.1 P-loop containing nucleoside triphosphate hydrolase protein [Cantharellus anzutake]